MVEEENSPISRIMLNSQPTHKVLPLLLHHPTAHNPPGECRLLRIMNVDSDASSWREVKISISRTLAAKT